MLVDINHLKENIGKIIKDMVQDVKKVRDYIHKINMDLRNYYNSIIISVMNVDNETLYNEGTI